MSDQKFDSAYFDGLRTEDLDRRRKNREKGQSKFASEEGREVELDTGAYGISIKNSDAVSTPTGLPKGKLFQNSEDFTR